MDKGMLGVKYYNPEEVVKISKLWIKGSKSALALQIAKLGLKDRGDLLKSISGRIRKKGGEVEAIRFQYLYYGLFHEVGAKNVFGKGVTLPGQKWQQSAINPRIEELANQVAEYYAEIAIKNIEFNTK